MNLISIAATGTMYKPESFKWFCEERYSYIRHQSHLATDLNQQMHQAPELSGSYEANLNEKLMEMIWTFVKLAGGDLSSLDHYLPYQLAFNKDEVLAGRTRVLVWAEDSGIVFEQINGKIRDLIINTPEVFGDMAELVKGLVADPQILKTFDKGFPGVETAPVLSALGREGLVKFLKKCCELLDLNPNPLEGGDIEKALRITQQSYLTYFLWYPGMKINPKNPASINYETSHDSAAGIFTARFLGRSEIDLDDCIIDLEKAQAGDFRVNAEQGDKYYVGPNTRWNAFEKMMAKVTSQEMLLASLKENYKPSIPASQILRGRERSFDIALISHDGNTSGIANQLRLKVPSSFKIQQFSTSDLLRANSVNELYNNMCGIDQLVNSADCFVFEPVPANLSPLEFNALSAVSSALLTYILTSPEHRNKRVFYRMQDGSSRELVDVAQAMAQRGMLADYIEYRGDSRLGVILTNPNPDELAARIRQASSEYFRVDLHNHGMEVKIEPLAPYKKQEGEIVAGMYCSAGARGTHDELSYRSAVTFFQNHYVGKWGMGDKVYTKMGAIYRAKLDMTKMGIDVNLVGCSTLDISSGETMSGKGVPGIPGMIYDSLIARTFDVDDVDVSHFSDGGQGTLLEGNVQIIKRLLGLDNSPIIVSTLDAGEPIRRTIERSLGKSDSVHLIDGPVSNQVKALAALIAPQGAVGRIFQRALNSPRKSFLPISNPL